MHIIYIYIYIYIVQTIPLFLKGRGGGSILITSLRGRGNPKNQKKRWKYGTRAGLLKRRGGTFAFNFFSILIGFTFKFTLTFTFHILLL